ncbi:hypothetical protein ACI3LY_003027 [Candidozyma auris]|uniref:Eukaryotic translation initiation factor 3 subunit M n=2 Tax=Candidozyma auris TaxID=498019 RepID=A0AB36W627_CANAR|nr:hypothetical protein QG37_00915 [[Candida] auris]PIS52114.1 hypothetical protein B9J08_003725 [[Candida] auris]PIS54101.1 hypothetical protein CJI97_003799 [[Candida] auris]QWW21583.1 hypothetical protein CA7LBN_000329 [[Candida] auris]
MASVIVVENEIKDSVEEFSSIVNTVQQNTDFSDSIKPYFDEKTGQIANKVELAKQISSVATPELLTKLSDREFEPIFYLLAYLRSELEQKSFETLLQKDGALINLLIASTPKQMPSLRDRRSLKPTTVLSVLNTFFNFLPASSPTRVFFIELILKIVTDTDIDFALIQSAIGSHIVQWLVAAGASEDQIKGLFWQFIALDKQYTLKSLHLIKQFTSQFSLTLQELHTMIGFALASPEVDVTFLVNNNVAQAMQQNASDELVSVFDKYTKGEFITSVPQSVSKNVINKSKVLALTRFFVESDNSGKNTFKYTDIPSELASSQEEFEKLLIDSIKAGVIEGKMNQVEQTFNLVRANRIVLAGNKEQLAKDLDTVKKALLEWRHSLDNINEIVRDAKDRIVNNNSGN